MTFRFLPWLAILLLVGSCRKATNGEGEGTVGEGGESRTRTRAPRDSDKKSPLERVRSDYDEALMMDEGTDRQGALAGVAWDALELDPELAQQAFENLEPGGAESRQLIGHFAMRLADSDPEGAIEWARSLQEVSERSDALGRVAVVISNQDPLRATELVMEEMESGLARDRCAVQIVQRWSQTAPDEAVKWIVGLEGKKVRQAGLKESMGRWADKDPGAVAEWLGAIEDASVLTESVVALSTSMVSKSEAEREELIEGIADRALRERLRARIEHQQSLRE